MAPKGPIVGGGNAGKQFMVSGRGAQPSASGDAPAPGSNKVSWSAADQTAPRYMVTINDTKLKDDVTSRIRSIHVDFDIDKATEIKIDVHDHDGWVSKNKFFAEGNLIHVYIGFSKSLIYLASGEIVKWAPVFPREGNPTLTIHAYDGSHASMDRQGHKGGSVMKQVRDSRVVQHKIAEHMGHMADCDTTDGIFNRIQRKGISDYQFVKRLALLSDFYYWCDWDLGYKCWVGHFKNKDKLRKAQEKMYSFIYNNDVAVSLLDFDLDFSMRGMPTDIEIVSFDQDLKKPINKVIRETRGQYLAHSPGPGSTDPTERKKSRKRDNPYVHKINEPTTYHGLGEKLNKRMKVEDSSFTDTDPFKGAIPKGTSLTFTCFGRRIYVVADKPFKNEKDAAGWAARFMSSRLENFVMGSGHVVGTPDLLPRQIHYLGELGPRFSGKWELTKVVHKVLTEGPYECDIEARKLYEPTDPEPDFLMVPVVPRMLFNQTGELFVPVRR
jgi:phage protein D